MDENFTPPAKPQVPPAFTAPVTVSSAPETVKSIICLQCHQLVPETAYFCPNCGKQLNEPPLSTSVAAQIGIYVLSAIMPLIGFIAIKYWRGIKYARSDDSKAQRIGYIAIAIMIISTVIIIWLTIAEIQSLQATYSNALSGY